VLTACEKSGFFRSVSESIVVVGLGQLGTVFADGFLRLGHPVIPALRGASLADLYEEHSPYAILVATGEDDLAGVLKAVPDGARDRVILIQNELRPDQWLAHGVEPTVAIVWFEKRTGKAPHSVLPSVLHGSRAAWMERCFSKLGLPCRTVTSMNDLCHELVLKNLYILRLNLTGLAQVGGASPQQARDLLSDYKNLLDDVVGEILAVEHALLAQAQMLAQTQMPAQAKALADVHLDEERLRAELFDALRADPEHSCAGRSARRRLARTLEYAERFSIDTPHLKNLI